MSWLRQISISKVVKWNAKTRGNFTSRFWNACYWWYLHIRCSKTLEVKNFGRGENERSCGKVNGPNVCSLHHAGLWSMCHRVNGQDRHIDWTICRKGFWKKNGLRYSSREKAVKLTTGRLTNYHVSKSSMRFCNFILRWFACYGW